MTFMNVIFLPQTENSPNPEDEEIRMFHAVNIEINPPHLCYNGQCNVYMKHVARLRIPLSLTAPDPPEDNSTSDSNWCTYRTGKIQSLSL